MLSNNNTTLAHYGLMLNAGSFSGASMIAAPGSTKNQDGELHPEMEQIDKGHPVARRKEGPIRHGRTIIPRDTQRDRLITAKTKARFIRA
ncbi:hypothetical protein WDZ92_39905 [Nostoc sp. NIES-2111]